MFLSSFKPLRACFISLVIFELKYGRTALRLIRRHERCSRKLARYANHLTFLIRCVVPRDLRVRSPVPTKGGHRVAEIASLRLLRERIRLAQRAKGNAMKDSHSTAKSITATLSPKDASEILEKISCNTKRLFNKTRDRQKRKFDDLLIDSTTRTPQVDKSKWVINLSSRSLSDAEVSLLQKGLNFAVTPTSIPATEIVAKVESAIRPLDAEQADTVRRNVNSILQKAKPAEPNITREMKQALKGLKEDKKIWKRYVDDTFTILSRDKVDIFLQHLNSQQPTIRFTMETETNNTIPVLDTLVTRDSDGYLSTSVYRKPTHTDQYLAYDSHHPQSVKRGIVKCLNDRSKHLITKSSVISHEKKHLSSVLVSNGYPFSFVKNITKTKKQTATKEPAPEIKSTAVLPYVKGLSEALRRCLQQQGIRTVFRSDTTLRSHLVRPKDTVDPAKQDGVVYKIHLRMWQGLYWRDGKIYT